MNWPRAAAHWRKGWKIWASRLLRAASSLLALLLSGCAGPDISGFERALASQDSATLALEGWCAERSIARPPAIRAAPVPGAATSLPADLDTLLDLSGGEPTGYRRVALSCGNVVLSHAHNWYVPGRLTQAMNAQLASSDTPFGKVAAPLGFRRERLESRRGRAAECPAGTVVSHRARLVLPDGRPLAVLVECYTAANVSAGAASGR